MISRRRFIQHTALATAALPWLNTLTASAQTIQSGYLSRIGLQLYTVREQMAADPQGTLQAIREAGYHQVETGDIRAFPKLLPMLQTAELSCESLFFPNALLTQRWDLVGEKQRLPKEYTVDSLIEDAVNNGLRYLVFGYLQPEERKTLDNYKQLIEQLNVMGEKCNQADINLCYHNHSFEFQPMEGTVPFELFIQEFEMDVVSFELDVFWASVGGYDPAELLERLKGRVRLMHIKDKLKGTPNTFDEAKVKAKAFQPLGKGVLDIPGILRTAEEVSVEHCFVEQDQAKDPMVSIKESIAYLEKTEARRGQK